MTADRNKVYEENAERVTLTVWTCKTCGSRWADTHDGERMARRCHASDYPCEEAGCAGRARSPWEVCDHHLAEGRARRWAERLARGVLWDGESTLYSDALERFYFHGEWDDDVGPDDEQAATVEALRLEVCKPRKGRHVDLADHLIDDLPDDDGDAIWQVRSPEGRAVEKAVNDFIDGLGTLSWFSTGEAAIVPGMTGWVPVESRPKAET